MIVALLATSKRQNRKVDCINHFFHKQIMNNKIAGGSLYPDIWFAHHQLNCFRSQCSPIVRRPLPIFLLRLCLQARFAHSIWQYIPLDRRHQRPVPLMGVFSAGSLHTRWVPFFTSFDNKLQLGQIGFHLASVWLLVIVWLLSTARHWGVLC